MFPCSVIMLQIAENSLMLTSSIYKKKEEDEMVQGKNMMLSVFEKA